MRRKKRVIRCNFGVPRLTAEWLTFPHLSSAEYAFVLPRAVGMAAYGQAGNLSYEGEVTNGIQALDAGPRGLENVGTNRSVP